MHQVVCIKIKGVPELQQWLEQALVEPFEVETRLIPDEQPLIEQTLKEVSG